MLQLEVIGNIGSDAIIKDFSGTKYVSFNVASEIYLCGVKSDGNNQTDSNDTVGKKDDLPF